DERVQVPARRAVERRVQHAVVADHRGRVVVLVAQMAAPQDLPRERIARPQRAIERCGEQDAVREDRAVPELQEERAVLPDRSEERRVGKEGRAQLEQWHEEQSSKYT